MNIIVENRETRIPLRALALQSFFMLPKNSALFLNPGNRDDELFGTILVVDISEKISCRLPSDIEVIPFEILEIKIRAL